MFDVQALRPLATDGTLPAPVLASIAAYYRRVLVETWPMGGVVGAVMAVLMLATLVGLLLEPPRWRGLVGLVLAGAPIALAFGRVVPNAVALGTGTGSAAGDTVLARGIAIDHVLCFAGLTAFLVLQLVPSTPPPRATKPEAG